MPSVRSHRRPIARGVIRGLEVGAWTLATAVATALIVFVVHTQASRQTTARFVAPDASLAVGQVCIFEPCPGAAPQGVPARLRIPTIGVDSALETIELDTSGRLKPPSSYRQVGWFASGVVPGDPGPAIFAGHVDSLTGPAIFYDLGSLTAGDVVEIDRGGVWLEFRVTSVEHHAKADFPAESIYRPTPTPELRLITCGGAFDRRQLSYRDNVVVFAVAK